MVSKDISLVYRPVKANIEKDMMQRLFNLKNSALLRCNSGHLSEIKYKLKRFGGQQQK